MSAHRKRRMPDKFKPQGWDWTEIGVALGIPYEEDGVGHKPLWRARLAKNPFAYEEWYAKQIRKELYRLLDCAADNSDDAEYSPEDEEALKRIRAFVKKLSKVSRNCDSGVWREIGKLDDEEMLKYVNHFLEWMWS